MPKASFIKTIVIGNLAEEFIINIDGKVINHIAGGSLLYAAAGAKNQNTEIGLVSRINESFPLPWIKQIEQRGFDIRGIVRVTHPFEAKRFLAWLNAENFDSENPVAHYARLGLTFPRELLNYYIENVGQNELVWGNVITKLKKELPREFLDVTAAHLCPLDFSTQAKLINLLETGTVNNLTISPSDQYMVPAYLEKLPVLLKGTTAFLPSEAQLTSLCNSRTKDIWEMMEMVTGMGCQMVVTSRRQKGHYLYDSASRKRLLLPAYPTRWLDPTGADDVFAGAFLGEYKTSYDSTRALIAGCVATSLAVEGSGPFYCMDALPGLAEMRFEKMQPLVCSQ